MCIASLNGRSYCVYSAKPTRFAGFTKVSGELDGDLLGCADYAAEN